jgi:ABC-type uncharacterized transport system auxiliary subunit
MRLRYLMVPILMCGCLTAPKLSPVQIYLVEPKPQVAAAEPAGKTLGVRQIEAARPYREQIAYRDKGMVLGYYPNAEWAELPAQIVTRALIDALTQSHRFSDVGYAGDLVSPDFILTGELRQFDLVRSTEPWTAAVEVRLELRGAMSPEIVWGQTLSATENLAKNEVSALPEAMSKAVSRVIEQAVAGIDAKPLSS